MPFRIPWPRSDKRDDPFWDFFIHHAPSDPSNMVAEAIRTAPEGNIYPTKTEVHSPDITAGHLKELARFWHADATGIVHLKGGDLPYAMVFGFYGDYDPGTAQGIGGQHIVLKGAYVAFELGAYIREMGYQATRTGEAEKDRLAAAAGLKAPPGKYLYITDILQTDLPLAADAEVEWLPTS
jgi:hypothetical protein